MILRLAGENLEKKQVPMKERLSGIRTWFIIALSVLAKIARAPLWLIWGWVLGHGVYPSRILSTITILFITIWICYWQFGTFVIESANSHSGAGRPSWHDALYYSFISFTALGYGEWAPKPTGWAKWLGAIQPMLGIFTAIILSIILTRRLGRRL